MALFLTADEALDQLDDQPDRVTPTTPVLSQCLGAAGVYLLHACELSNLQLGELISEQLARDEGELPAARSIR